jgi:hypothetical protein
MAMRHLRASSRQIEVVRGAAGVGLGVTAGVVAGGLLLDAAEDWFSDEL